MLGSAVTGEALELAEIDGYISTEDYADLVTWLEDKTDFLDAMPRQEIATLIRSSFDERNFASSGSAPPARQKRAYAAIPGVLTPPSVRRMHTSNNPPAPLPMKQAAHQYAFILDPTLRRALASGLLEVVGAIRPTYLEPLQLPHL